MSVKVKWKYDNRKLHELIKKTSGPAVKRIVSDGVEYGVYVELGTSKMPARPCAVPAAERVFKHFFVKGFKAAFEGGDISLKAAETVVDKTAFEFERHWKLNIINAPKFGPGGGKGAIDTSAYLNSIHVRKG